MSPDLLQVPLAMANTIPCPNPVCTHSFNLAEVQSSAQLLCPKCGFRMQGKAPAKPTPPPPTAKAAPPDAKSIAKPAPAPAKVPMATPIAAAKPPMATPVAAAPVPSDESLPDDSFFNPDVAGSGAALVRTSARPKKKLTWPRLLINVFAVGFAVCVVVAGFAAAVMWMPGVMSKNGGDARTGLLLNSKNQNEKIYKLSLSDDDWQPDLDIKKSFKAHSAWKLGDDFWFAILVKDYGLFKARDAEMMADAIDKLEQFFGTDLEIAKMAESVKFAGLNAQKLAFVGTANSTKWFGECYIFFNNGVGYWVFAASSDPQVLERLANDLAEKSFVVVSDRRGWREQPTPMVTYKSENEKIEVTVPKDVWEKSKTPKDEYETGELVMAGIYKREKDGRKNALVSIFTMEKKGDLAAMAKAAQEFLNAKFKQDNELFKVVPLDASEGVPGQKDTGELTSVGNRRGRIVDLKLQFQDEKKRYFLLAVIAEADVCYVILCECSYESRQIWRQDFLEVLRSLNVK